MMMGERHQGGGVEGGKFPYEGIEIGLKGFGTVSKIERTWNVDWTELKRFWNDLEGWGHGVAPGWVILRRYLM